jgi:hypothetical protein
MRCQTCGATVDRLACEVDPRRAVLVWLAGCGHLLTDHEAQTAWRTHGLRCHVPDIDGPSLIAAERARHTGEEGHTPDKDAALTGGQLSWAAWSLIDRAGAKHPVEQPPSVWPLPRDRWPRTTSPLRLLIIAGSFIAAEIDRRLARGEKP